MEYSVVALYKIWFLSECLVVIVIFPQLSTCIKNYLHSFRVLREGDEGMDIRSSYTMTDPKGGQDWAKKFDLAPIKTKNIHTQTSQHSLFDYTQKRKKKKKVNSLPSFAMQRNNHDLPPLFCNAATTTTQLTRQLPYLSINLFFKWFYLCLLFPFLLQLHNEHFQL